MLSLAWLGCDVYAPAEFPQPTDETHIKMDMEEGKDRALKQRWLSNLHKCAPNTNWQQIEFERSLERLHIKLKQQTSDSKNGNIEIADGSIIGNWLEKGSTNQAGSVLKTTVNKNSDLIYAVAAGGSLWYGDLNGTNWYLANHDVRFDGKLLACAYLPSGLDRLLLSISGIPFYSDGGGLELQMAQGYPSSVNTRIKHTNVVNNGKEVFIISQPDENENFEFYFSSDHGASYQNLFTFFSTDYDEIAMVNTDDENAIYIMERKTATTSRMYKWNPNTKKLDLINGNLNRGFGPNGVANITHSNVNNTIELFFYDDAKNFYKSSNNGNGFSFVGKLPKLPWGVGVHISKSNPNNMLMGEVELYRSTDGGQNWDRVNFWWEYYANTDYKIHADIMDIGQFKTSNGSYITLISNHGGISSTNDFGALNVNITKDQLNISQYYDVKTKSAVTDFIFAGSQDQGIQRAFDIDEGELNFDQMTSGDYDHITFTGNEDENMWVVYPLGEVNFYDDPLGNEAPLRFTELASKNQSVWLPHIAKKKNNLNEVYLAGGNIDNSSGKHLIRLSVYEPGNLSSHQMPFDFSVSGGEISAIAFDHFDSNILYVSTSNGKFYKSTDNGENFQAHAINIPGVEYLFPNHILPSKKFPKRIYLSGSGYDNSGVVLSIDGGASFQDLNNGLPRTAIFDLATNPDETLLFAATEAGPFVYIFEKEEWFYMGAEIAPNQSFWSVEFIADSKVVRFGTFGRGIWDFNIVLSTDTHEQTTNTLDIKVSPNPTSEWINIQFDNPSLQGKPYKIYSHKGEEIYSSSLKHFENIVDCSMFSQGHYILVIENDHNIISKSFIKI